MAEISDTILLVEDCEPDAFLFERALRAAGIGNPLHVATDGQKAVDRLAAAEDAATRKESPVPCIIFLDLKLPYQNGFEVLQWLRTRPHLDDTVVIVLTGSEEPRDRRQAYALGARSYLVKPASPAQIRDVLDSLQPYWAKLGADPIAFGAPSDN